MRWCQSFLLLGWVFVRALAADCLLGCTLQGISPFSSEDSDWEDISVCDASKVGCNVITGVCEPNTGYPRQYNTDLCIWSSRVGTANVFEGDDTCTCHVCGGLYHEVHSFYMDELSIWDRLRCVIHAAELKGYDMSPCVEAVLDRNIPCVDEADWASAAVGMEDCDGLDTTDTDEAFESQCIWNGTTRMASELFETSMTPAPVMTVTTAPPQIPTSPPSLPEVTPEPSMSPPSSSPENIPTQSPVAVDDTGTSIEEEPPTPAPSTENVVTDSTDVESQGEGGGLSTGSIVGIIVGILAVLGGATLVIRIACQDVEFHCFNDCFNRR